MSSLKTPQASAVEATHMVLPHDANVHGNIFGGTIMSWIDIAAACVAYRHCRTHTVTASMDELTFLHPVKVGDIVTLKARVNYVGRASMEIGVKVIAENPLTGEECHTSSAYLTFVAVNTAGKPIAVPPLTLETDDDRRRAAAAELRRRERLKRRKGS